jgi:hypothetical protein
MSNTEKIASLRRLSRDRGATKAERAAAKAKADELEFPGRKMSDTELEAKVAIARREAEDAAAKVKEADNKIKEANGERQKLLRLHSAAADALAKFTAETQLRQELKLRRLSEAELGEMLVSGSEAMKAMVNNEITNRRKQRLAERMREVTFHQLCVIYFEQIKEKLRGYDQDFHYVYTHNDDERKAAQTEIYRRIKRPEVGALGDHREDRSTDDDDAES